MPISQLAIWPEKTISRRLAATARSTYSKPRVSTRPPGSKTHIFRRCGYSAATRPRLLHMLPVRSAISVSESSGKARRVLRRACLEAPKKGADATRQRAADGGSAVERQKFEHAEKSRSPSLQTIGEPWCSNGKVRAGLSHCRGRYHNGRDKPSKLRGMGPASIDTRTTSITIVIRRARPVAPTCNSSSSARDAGGDRRGYRDQPSRLGIRARPGRYHDPEPYVSSLPPRRRDAADSDLAKVVSR